MPEPYWVVAYYFPRVVGGYKEFCCISGSSREDVLDAAQKALPHDGVYLACIRGSFLGEVLWETNTDGGLWLSAADGLIPA